jgi:hypothetical protein
MSWQSWQHSRETKRQRYERQAVDRQALEIEIIALTALVRNRKSVQRSFDFLERLLLIKSNQLAYLKEKIIQTVCDN